MEVVTIDLMYRAPGQTLSDWEADLRLAGRLGLDHLTTFSLFVDPGTPMYEGDAMSGSAGQPDEETELAMYRMALDILGAEGYSLYTLYDFARPGAECVHHAINWRAPQGDYAGLGPGAFSFIRDGSASHIYCNESSLDRYADAIAAGRQPVAMGKRLSLEEEMSRYVALGVNFLRVPRDPFRRQFGLDLERVYAKELDRLICWGLVELGTQEMVLTDKGRIYLANVSKEFFTGENRGKPHVVGMELQKGEGLSLMAVRSNAG
jgi:oxygen-independent coproporphyrinogen-3 oxidase